MLDCFLTALLASAAGIPAGLALAQCGRRLRAALLGLTLIPLAVPPALTAIEAIALGLPQVVAPVLAAVYWPIPLIFNNSGKVVGTSPL